MGFDSTKSGSMAAGAGRRTMLASFAMTLLAACSVGGSGTGNGRSLASGPVRASTAVAQAGGLAVRVRQARANAMHATGLAGSMPSGAQVAGSIASLPDRGELAQPTGARSIRDGAYTWHPVRLSEEHALRSLATGVMRLRAPSGALLTLRLDRVEEHPTGDWTWVGSVDGVDPAMDQAIITFGDKAVFGSIPQGVSGGPPLSLNTRGSGTMLGETTSEALRIRNLPLGDDAVMPPAIAMAGTRPMREDADGNRDRQARGNDVAPVQDQDAPASALMAEPDFEDGLAIESASIHKLPTVDLLAAYPYSLAVKYGSASAVVTRLNFKNDEGNAALARSGVRGRVRLVHTVMISGYPLKPNGTVLSELQSGSSASLRSLSGVLRDRYGADLVTMFKEFTPGDDSCGVAYVVGGGQSDVSQQQHIGFSVINDENFGPCYAQTYIHELGHNLGQVHDKVTSQGSAGGAHTYSWGYRTSRPDGVGFTTIMAYPDTGPYYFLFSTPYRQIKGVNAGTTGENNASSLNKTFPQIATFRATKVFGGVRARNDVNGDGKSDLLFQNFNQRLASFWQMSGSTVAATPPPKATAANGKLVASGDFNGDGRTDLVWMNAARELWLWRSTGSGWNGFRIETAGLTRETDVVGAADLDGDRKDELLLVGGNRFTYWKLSATTPIRGTTYTLPAGARLVAAGDLNADGKQDLVWMSSTRQLYLWWSNGGDLAHLNFAHAKIGDRLSAGWVVLAAADVSGDGKSDLLFHKPDTGQFAYWVMNRNLVVSTGGRSIGTSARFAATGDFNGDGNVDMVWRRGTELIMWFSDGKQFPWQYRTIARPLPGSWHTANGGVGGG